MRTTEGAVADPTALQGLRDALATDSFPPANTRMKQAQLPSSQPSR